jgi:hypothetical protein
MRIVMVMMMAVMMLMLLFLMMMMMMTMMMTLMMTMMMMIPPLARVSLSGTAARGQGHQSPDLRAAPRIPRLNLAFSRQLPP